MKTTLATLFLAVPLFASAQIVPPSPAQNPFTGSSAPILPTPLSQSSQNSLSMSAPLPLFEPMLPMDVKTMLEGMVLVGRTDRHAVLGFQVVGGAQLGYSTPGRNLKEMTVKNGATFYLSNRKVRLVLDPDSTGIYITEAQKDGAVLWFADIDSPRTVYPTSIQNEQTMSAGFGVGQSPRPVSGSNSNSPFGSSPASNANSGQPGVR
jgi:hypothetical protein